ncbi:MAG: hypothetical protein JO037_11990 [Actinobacteria bacterium]|nr:hypothetical protein [Actinomycetota bacterium]
MNTARLRSNGPKFLMGIGTSFKLKGVRYALIPFGSVLLIVSVVLILPQPGPPS